MKNKKIIALLLITVFSFSFCYVINAAPEGKTVLLGGQTVGVALYTKGLLVTDTLAVEDSDGKYVMPSNLAGIKKGDYIIKANDIELKDVSNLDAIMLSCDGNEIEILYIRDNNEYTTTVKPVLCKNDSKYRLGMMLRDSAAGIGTVTFSDNSKYMALGHSINDADCGTLLTIDEGRIVRCTVTGVVKSEVQKPGELKGSFGVNAEILGTVENNTEFGIVGNKNDKLCCGKEIEIADKKSVSEGEAVIYSDFEGNGVKPYEIEISKINTLENNTTRNFLIKITDENLIEKTGGIVQGLSGSPIVQNGKLVGAVTHVLLSDPTKGYGIFIENMLQMSA